MSKIEKLIEIAAPQEQVFAAFSDADNIRRWLPAIERTQLIEGNHSLWSLGTNDGASHDANADVVERRAPEYIRWRVSRGGESADVTGELIETQAGGTLLRLAIETAATDATLTTHSLPLLLLGGGNFFAAEKNFENRLERFKEFAEGGDDDTPAKERSLPVDDRPSQSTSPASSAAAIATESAVAATPASDVGVISATSNLETAESEATLIRPSPNLPARRSAPPTVAPGSTSASPQAATAMGARRRPSPTSATLILLALLVISALALLWLWQRAPGSQTDGAAQQTTGAAGDQGPAFVNTSPATAPATASSSTEGIGSVAPSATTTPRPSIANDANTASSNTGTSPRRARDAETATLRKNLDTWITATNDADLDTQLRLYAPVLERYYLRTNFPRAAVREDKVKLMKRARLIGVNVEDLEITFSPDGQTATMRFRKEYRFEGSATRNAVLQELRWRKTEDGWRIISERDLRVLR